MNKDIGNNPSYGPDTPKEPNKDFGQARPKLTADQIAGANLICALKELNKNWPMQLEMFAVQARACKGRFDAAIAEGFNEKQALEICTKAWSL